MYFLLLFLLQLFLLYFLSRKLTRSLSLCLYKLTKSKKITVYLLALLFLPGTIIHELAHAITAGILGAHVGKITLFPEIEGEMIKLGSVQVAKTDMVRRFFIGTAPFIVGTVLILGLMSYATHNNLLEKTWMIGVLGYAIFEIGNTMFSSKKDMEGAIELLLIICVILLICYLLGVRMPSWQIFAFGDQETVQFLFRQASMYLFFPIIVDCLCIAVLALCKR